MDECVKFWFDTLIFFCFFSQILTNIDMPLKRILINSKRLFLLQSIRILKIREVSIDVIFLRRKNSKKRFFSKIKKMPKNNKKHIKIECLYAHLFIRNFILILGKL